MFRGGGKVSSYGNGIATGLADGGKVQPLLVGQHLPSGPLADSGCCPTNKGCTFPPSASPVAIPFP